MLFTNVAMLRRPPLIASADHTLTSDVLAVLSSIHLKLGAVLVEHFEGEASRRNPDFIVVRLGDVAQQRGDSRQCDRSRI